MADRFLGWQLPEDFSPDGGISFQRYPGHFPVGTNLLTATQAEAMVQHLLGGRTPVAEQSPTPVPKSGAATPITREEADDRLGRGLHAEWAEGIGWHYFASYDPPAAPLPPAPAAEETWQAIETREAGDWRSASGELLGHTWEPPRLTASLDAIAALIAEKLPGASWQCGFVSEHHSDFETPQGGWGRVFVRDEDAEVVQAKTPALALCAAFLRALASTEDRTP